MMIHDLDTLRWYFGEIERVYARGLSYSPHRTTVDYALAIIRFASGVSPMSRRVGRTVTSARRSRSPGRTGIIRHAARRPPRCVSNRPRRRCRPAGVNVPRSPLAESPYPIELRHFLDRLADGAPFLTDGDEATRSLAAALAVLEAVRTGNVIPFIDGWPTLESPALVSNAAD